MTSCGGSSATQESVDQAGDGICSEPPAGRDMPESATVAFMEPCTPGDDASCETGLCFTFNSRGSFCSMACTEACHCPGPSRGCSNMGVCKSPE